MLSNSNDSKTPVRRVLPGEISTIWEPKGSYKDIFLDLSPEGIARIAINRPQ